MQVNLLREYSRFIVYAHDESLTQSEQCLWYALVQIINRHGDGSEWPDGYIRITKKQLDTLYTASWDTMARARNGLKQHGLLDFRNGSRNKEAPEYKLFLFGNSYYPQNWGKNKGKPEGNGEGKPEGNGEGKTPSIINKLNMDGIINRNTDEEDDDADDISAGGRGRDALDRQRELARAVRDGFREIFGRVPYSGEVDSLVRAAKLWGFDGEMVVLAMEKAARNGARNPARLALTILGEWRENEVLQPRQAEEYQFEYDSREGRNGLYGSGDVVEDYRAAEEAKRRRREENQLAGYA